jgi:hypothetical protein
MKNYITKILSFNYNIRIEKNERERERVNLSKSKFNRKICLSKFKYKGLNFPKISKKPSTILSNDFD